MKSRGAAYRAVRRLRNRAAMVRYRAAGIDPDALVCMGSTIASDIVVGPHAFVAAGCRIGSQVEIGPFSLLAGGVSIVGADHRIDCVGTPIVFSGREDLPVTRIGMDVWIGQGATVVAGNSVGDGAIVATGAVVTNDVEPGQVVGGVPARPLRDRFESPEVLAAHLSQVRQSLNGPGIDLAYAEKRT